MNPRALFEEGLDVLAARDSDLASVIAAHGRPEFWSREPGFSALVLIILEQQVSLASAKAAFNRMVEDVGVPTPESFLRLDAETLRSMGFSRQKARYCRILAEEVSSGKLDLDAVGGMTDDAARSTLMQVTGIGRWTADIYLLCALSRPDVWPVGDLALVGAIQQVKGLDRRPSPVEFESLGEQWRPWRSVAAQILWHHYLGVRKLKVKR